jgi:hypothetical protein
MVRSLSPILRAVEAPATRCAFVPSPPDAAVPLARAPQ